jgi:hypothetical protein
MNKIKKEYIIVTATPEDLTEFNKNSQLALSLDKLNIRKNSIVKSQNTQGLPSVYNSFITEENRQKYIIFIHDDVLIEDLFFEEKLQLAFEKYDIVGLAGSKKCDLNAPMSAWHLMSDRNDWVGEVSHSKDKKCWTTVFGNTDSRALILDGLFIGVDVSKLLDTNTRFDENFSFHHYDISFCLRANSNKLKMGVYPIKVTHFGMGDSMNSPEWHESAKKFKALYK